VVTGWVAGRRLFAFDMWTFKIILSKDQHLRRYGSGPV
jgi:hypothetical protein